MPKVSINEKDNELLSRVISQITSFYSKNKKIDCIYIRYYIVYQSSKNIRLCLIYNEPLEGEELCDLSGIINTLKEKTGINLIISLCDNCDYKVDMSYSREIIACRELYNGEILFDRTGYHRWLQTELSSYHDYLTTKVISNFNFEPPLKLTKSSY